MRQKPLYMHQPELSKSYRSLYDPVLSNAHGVPFPAQTLQRHVGIEIEVEDCGDKPFRLVSWHVERDGSLRGENSYEFKTMFPSNCQNGLDSLREFFNMVSRFRSKFGDELFSFSERTSIHVHVDVRDLTEDEIKSVVKLYMIFEKSFFDLVGRDRKYNIFCIPITESNILGMANPKRNGKWWDVWEKYCAINLACIKLFGTVEFRAMAGNDNLELINSWVLMLSALVEYAANKSPDEVNEIINVLKTESQYQQLANDIFGQDLAGLLTMFPEASDSAASLTKLL